MLVAVLVVADRVALQRVLGGGERHAAVADGRGGELERGERRAGVAAGAVGEERQRVVVGARAVQLAAVDRAPQEHLDVVAPTAP